MPKYINADELIKFLQTTRKNLPYDSKDFFTRDEMLLNFEQMINVIPAADVQEVKHAKWKLVSTYRDEEGYLNDIFRCSNCHIPFDENTRYCPNCGAKMQPDENKEEFNNA